MSLASRRPRLKGVTSRVPVPELQLSRITTTLLVGRRESQSLNVSSLMSFSVLVAKTSAGAIVSSRPSSSSPSSSHI
jgi:hypothetical protein